MKKLLLAVLWLTLPSVLASAQDQQTIETIEISGVPEDRLSSALREELEKLRGQQYNAQASNDFADRIQSELPEYVAASRIMPGTQPDRIRLIFAVAEISDRDSLGTNINARYTVESVDVTGIPRTQVSDDLYAEMQRMVGQQLNDDTAEGLRQRLATALGKRFGVDRRVRRGQTRQHIRILYEAYRIPWLPFSSEKSFISYHPKLGMGFAFNAEFAKNRRSRCLLGIANSGDELLERYKGFRLGCEQVSIGTERLGVKLDYTAYGSRWKFQTQPDPDLYRSRRTLEPSVSFAFSPSLYATAGISMVDLEMQSPADGSRSASAAIASLKFRQTFKTATGSHELNAGYDVRSGTRTLDSDYVYARHTVEGTYTFSRDKSAVSMKLMGGRITGNAPMFDRFSLGNTETLRGWNKFDLAPVGTNRFVHGSLEYAFNVGGRISWKGQSDNLNLGIRTFYDIGSVWDSGTATKAHSSVGIALGSRETALTLAFRIRGAHLTPSVMFAFHF